MLDEWIDEVGHHFYNDKQLRDKFFKKMQQSKDVDELLAQRCPYHRKQLFMENLKLYACKKLYKRRKRVLQKSLEYALKHAAITNDYNYRLNFVESQIEEAISYFASLSRRPILHNIDIASLFRLLRKNREIIVKRGGQGIDRKNIYKNLLNLVKELFNKKMNGPDKRQPFD